MLLFSTFYISDHHSRVSQYLKQKWPIGDTNRKQTSERNEQTKATEEMAEEEKKQCWQMQNIFPGSIHVWM